MEVLAVAASYVGMREKGANRGPVEKFLTHVNLPPGKPYCAGYVSCVIWEAAMKVPVMPKFKRSAGALRLLERNPDLIIDRATAVKLMRQGRPVVAVFDHGGGKGHCCFGIGMVDDERFRSNDPNTGPGPSAPKTDRDGQGIYERTDRKLVSVYRWMRIANADL
jgi:hypothetical protein